MTNQEFVEKLGLLSLRAKRSNLIKKLTALADS